jgi:hypothetical protein
MEHVNLLLRTESLTPISNRPLYTKSESNKRLFQEIQPTKSNAEQSSSKIASSSQLFAITDPFHR